MIINNETPEITRTLILFEKKLKSILLKIKLDSEYYSEYDITFSQILEGESQPIHSFLSSIEKDYGIKDLNSIYLFTRVIRNVIFHSNAIFVLSPKGYREYLTKQFSILISTLYESDSFNFSKEIVDKFYEKHKKLDKKNYLKKSDLDFLYLIMSIRIYLENKGENNLLLSLENLSFDDIEEINQILANVHSLEVKDLEKKLSLLMYFNDVVDRKEFSIFLNELIKSFFENIYSV